MRKNQRDQIALYPSIMVAKHQQPTAKVNQNCHNGIVLE
jgi:hypothetical protein